MRIIFKGFITDTARYEFCWQNCGNSRKIRIVMGGKICYDMHTEEPGVYFDVGSHIIYGKESYEDDNDPFGLVLYNVGCKVLWILDITIK